MLRVRVELVPHGVEEFSEVIEEAFIANDGTGRSGGPNDGGVGNYDISEHNLAVEWPAVERDRPEYLGRIENLIRVPEAHRVTMARTALERIERRRYQENGGIVTDELPQFGPTPDPRAESEIDLSDSEVADLHRATAAKLELGQDGHGVGCEDYDNREDEVSA